MGVQHARRKRGAGSWGIVMGIRKELMEKGTRIEIRVEGRMVGWVRQKKEKWRIVGVYVSQGIEKMLKRVEQWMEEKEEGVSTIVGGDFNARTERKGGLSGEEGEER